MIFLVNQVLPISMDCPEVVNLDKNFEQNQNSDNHLKRVRLPKNSLVFAFLSFISAVSIDCPDMINMATSIGLNVQKPAIMASIRADCCSAIGIIV